MYPLKNLFNPVLLIHHPSLFASFLGGKRKGQKKNQLYIFRDPIDFHTIKQLYKILVNSK